MQSKSKASCRQAAPGLRQACRKSGQADYQRETTSSQTADKLKTSPRQVPQNCLPSEQGFVRLMPPFIPPCRVKGVETVGLQKKGVLIFRAFRSALLDSSEGKRTILAWLRWRASWAVSGCHCALAPRGAPRLPAPLRPPCNRFSKLPSLSCRWIAIGEVALSALAELFGNGGNTRGKGRGIFPKIRPM